MIQQRILTALVLAAALLLVIFVVPPQVASILLGLFVGVGAWEWSRLAGITSVPRQAMFVSGCVLVGVVALTLSKQGALPLLQWADVVVWVAGLFWMVRFPVPIPRAFAVCSGLLVLPLGWLFLTILLTQWGAVWVLFLFAVTAGADVGAFFTGRAFGRHKLAPAVSPGKTWEGVAGGLVCAGAVGLAAAAWFDLPAVPAVVVAAGIAAFSIVGDLTVSMLKRDVGLKDSGSIFPGHGGVLDRIDSLLAAIPLFLIGFGGMLIP
jgi:phosphatidate cytidylyltransferase